MEQPHGPTGYIDKDISLHMRPDARSLDALSADDISFLVKTRVDAYIMTGADWGSAMVYSDHNQPQRAQPRYMNIFCSMCEVKAYVVSVSDSGSRLVAARQAASNELVENSLTVVTHEEIRRLD